MTTRGIFRGYRSERGQRPRPVAITGPRTLRTTWQAARQHTAVARRAVPSICDAFSLILAVLLTVRSWWAVGYGAAVFILLCSNGWQRLRICLRLSDEVPRLAAAVILPLPLFLFQLPVNRGVLVKLVVLSGGLIIAMRFALYTMLRVANRRRWLAQRTLIVGAGKLGVEIWELLQEHSELGLKPVGFVDDTAPDWTRPLPLLGEVSDLPNLVSAYDIHRIIVTFPPDGEMVLVSVLRAAGQLSAEVCVVPRMYDLASAIPPSSQDDIWGIPLIPLRCSGLRISSRVAKRTFDIVAGTILLLAFAPLIVLLMGGVVQTCGLPALFRQARVTRSGRIMKIRKLRTVVRADLGGRWAVSPEDCSALGRWLRKTHLDELPQLLNVIRGEMSLVGPRPERPCFTSQFAEIVPHYEDRHRTNGGMTGWAQVHGLTGDTSIHERVRFDNNYIEHWSLWLDLVILARTFLEPLRVFRTKR